MAAATACVVFIICSRKARKARRRRTATGARASRRATPISRPPAAARSVGKQRSTRPSSLIVTPFIVCVIAVAGGASVIVVAGAAIGTVGVGRVGVDTHTKSGRAGAEEGTASTVRIAAVRRAHTHTHTAQRATPK